MTVITDLPEAARFYITCNMNYISEHEPDEPCPALTSLAPGGHLATTPGYTDVGGKKMDTTSAKYDAGVPTGLIIGQFHLDFSHIYLITFWTHKSMR